MSSWSEAKDLRFLKQHQFNSSQGAVIYYTTDGATPTTASSVYSGAITVSVNETVQAIATAPGLLTSSMVSAGYMINPAYTINLSQGFTQALSSGQMVFRGSTGLDDFRLQLTNGEQFLAGSAFYSSPVNIQAFTTDFTFQQSNAAGDGFTFTIQNQSVNAIGGGGGGLGYVGIPKSLAIKFDLYSNAGEGPNSTGLYINGAVPTLPAINLANSRINLHSGDYTTAHVTYDGTNLSMTLTDIITLATWSYTWPINIPAIVGGNTAYVGFTGGTGRLTSSQKVASWTYIAGQPASPNYPAGFDAANLVERGAATLSGTNLQLTGGGANQVTSVYYAVPVAVGSFSTSFQFVLTSATADGFAFVLQNASPNAIGTGGGGLGYATMPNSVAIKFDLYNNAGEGPDSTGLYINGAEPTVPSINLSSTGINLHSEDLFNAQLAYDGTTLTVVITDTVTNASATQTYTVNIPVAVGRSTAYVGFTGATGGGTVLQNIVNWTYSTASTN